MKKVYYLFCLIALGSCQHRETGTSKNLLSSHGTINHLLVVMDNASWKGELGDEVRRLYASQLDGVINSEPILTLKQVPLEVFEGFVARSRTVLLIEKGKPSDYSMRTDEFATPQLIVHISGMDDAEIMELIDRNAEGTIQAIKELELKEKQHQIQASLNHEKVLEKRLGIKLSLPSVYSVVKEEDNFVWIERSLPNGTSNLIAYSIPFGRIPKDSLTSQAVVKLRDSIGKKYVPGRRENSYMITEKVFSPFLSTTMVDGHFAFEVRGRWELENDFMAGPFITYLIDDADQNRQLVLEGFVFAPMKNKRDYLFELEAIIKSLKMEGVTKQQ